MNDEVPVPETREQLASRLIREMRAEDEKPSENTVRAQLVDARDAIDHALSHMNLVPTEMLIAVTEKLDEHPEGWEWPCACKECCSCG